MELDNVIAAIKGGLVNDAVVEQEEYRKKHKIRPLKSVPEETIQVMKTEIFLNSNYEMRKNLLTGVAEYREKFSDDQRFKPLTEEIATLIEENEPFQHLNDLTEMIGETFRRPKDDEQGKWWSLSDISQLLASRYPNFDPETPFKKIGNALNEIQFNFKSKRTAKHMEYWLKEK